MTSVNTSGAVRSVVLVLVGMGIGLSVSAVSGAGSPDLSGVERVVIEEAGGTREVVLGKVDKERFGMLVRDREGGVELFVGLRGDDEGERAECRGVGSAKTGRYEVLLSAWGKGSEMWVKHRRDGELLSRLGMSLTEEEVELLGESRRGGEDECGTAMRWSSETGALELEGCEEFLWRKWHRTKRYAP